MKKNSKTIFKALAVCFISSTLFIVSGKLYLERKLMPAKSSTESEPYYSYVPECCGIMFDLCGDRTLIYLDFEGASVTAVMADGKEANEIYGYSVDYTVSSDYSLAGGIADLLGGIDIEAENGILSLTGSQLEERLSTTADGGMLRRAVTEKIISKIGKNGLAREDFLYIIENSETDLTVPDCFYWSDCIKELCINAKFLGYGEDIN